MEELDFNMARKMRKSQKENFAKIKEVVDTQKSEFEAKLPAIARDSGGSLDKLPVKTKAFQQWLTEHQYSNPFIGKHVTSAPEYGTKQKDLESEVVEVTPELLKSMEYAEFDSTSDDGLKEEDLGEAPKVNDDVDKKFIDITITENATRRLSERTNEEIEEHAINTMRSYHDNPDYETRIELNSVIDNAKSILLESGLKNKKYLSNK